MSLPMQPVKKHLSFSNINHTLLLGTLILTLAVLPIFERYPLALFLIHLGYNIIFLTGVFLYFRRKSRLKFGIALILILVLLTWVNHFHFHPALFVANGLLDSTVFAVLAGQLVISLLKKHMGTFQSILGAISGYLLLGLSWAILYSVSERLNNQSLLSAVTGEQISDFSQFVYFSFVTMSTLGYGDIHPGTQVTRTLAWMQSVVGQFYLAVLVARLVSEIPLHQKIEDGKES